MTSAETGPDAHADQGAPRTDRRRLLHGVAAGGLALPLIAACGGSGGSGSSGSSGASSSSSSQSSDPGSGAATVAAADVPVGGGTILTGQKAVVTQPTKGSYRAFSAVCTHQGCLVNKLVDGKIECPCHGSAFSIEDGSPVSGPAQRPLPGKKVAVAGGKISVT